MSWNIPLTRSLKTRVISFSLAVLLIGFWSLAFYVSQALRVDMQRLLGDQQLSTVSSLATQVDHALNDRLNALHAFAARISPAMLADKRSTEAFLFGRVLLRDLFSGGIMLLEANGTPVAKVPLTTGWREAGAVMLGTAALDAERARITPPYIDRMSQTPVFAMTVPIRDTHGRTIGIVVGLTRLDQDNFLDRIGGGANGQAGGHVLAVLQSHLIVTASDKSRIMTTLPSPGDGGLLDRFMQGHEGSGVIANSRGVEMLVSVKHVAVADWCLAATLPTAEAFAPVRAMQQRMLLATILLTLVTGFLIWWILRRQLEPIVVATRVLATQTETNLPPQPLPGAGQDEIGQLIGGFNRLLETLTQREDALRESEARLQATFDATPDLMFEMGLDGCYYACHSPRYDLLIAPPESLIGQRVTDVLPADAAAVGLAALQEADQAGFSSGKQYALSLPQGIRWFELSVARKSMLSNEGPRFIVLARDISERKRAEEQLHKMTTDLEVQVNARTEELRTISAQLTLIEERERRLLAQELHDNVGQLLAVIKISLSALEHGSAQFSISHAINLVDQTDQAVRTISQQWSPPLLKVLGFVPALKWLGEDIRHLYGINVHVEIETCKRPLADETQALLFRSVRELLINVARHAKGSDAQLSVHCDGRRLLIVVRDVGCGFDPVNMQGGEAGHLTFGLSSIHERMQALGGEMVIESSVGIGTTVTLSVPCAIANSECLAS